MIRADRAGQNPMAGKLRRSTAKLKILVVTDRYPPSFEGGYELTCYANVRGLTKRGHNVKVLTSDFCAGSDRGEYSDKDVFRVLMSARRKVDFHRAYVRSLVVRAFIARKNYYITRKMLRDFNPQLVYSFRVGDTTFSPLVAACHAHTPIVADIGDYSWANINKIFLGTTGLIRMRKKIVFGFFDVKDVKIAHYIANSERVASELQKIQVAGDAMTILPRYISPDVETELSRSMEDPRPDIGAELRIIYGGRLCRDKGILTLVDIVREVKKRAVTSRLVVDLFGRGSPAFEAEVQARIRKLDLADEVCLRGLVPEREFVRRLKNYHIFLFPFQWNEPFGRVVIQAMAAGVVVVASRKGGPIELIEDDNTGFLVRAGYTAGFADVITRLSLDKEKFQQVARKATRLAREKYSAGAIFPSVERTLLDCATSS